MQPSNLSGSALFRNIFYSIFFPCYHIFYVDNEKYSLAAASFQCIFSLNRPGGYSPLLGRIGGEGGGRRVVMVIFLHLILLFNTWGNSPAINWQYHSKSGTATRVSATPLGCRNRSTIRAPIDNEVDEISSDFNWRSKLTDEAWLTTVGATALSRVSLLALQSEPPPPPPPPAAVAAAVATGFSQPNDPEIKRNNIHPLT